MTLLYRMLAPEPRRLRIRDDRARALRRPGRRGLAGRLHGEPGAVPRPGRAVGPAPSRRYGALLAVAVRPGSDPSDRAAPGARGRVALGRAVAASRGRALPAGRGRCARRSWSSPPRPRSCSGRRSRPSSRTGPTPTSSRRARGTPATPAGPPGSQGSLGGSDPALTLVVAAACAALVFALICASPRGCGASSCAPGPGPTRSYILGSTKPTTSIFRYALLAVVPWWPFPEIGLQVTARRDRLALDGPGDPARHRLPARLASVVLGDRAGHPQLPLSGD